MKRKRIIMLFIFIILVLFVTIGYSVLSVSLNINGLSTINNSSWDIHFENVQVKNGSVAASIPTISSNRTAVIYSVELDKPGDYYEFTVDVKNDGTIDGMVDIISSKLNGIEITSLPDYLEYYITYADGAEILKNQLLAAGDKETIKVYVGYKKDVNASQLPTEDQTLNLSFTITYVQVTGDAFKIRTYKYTSAGRAHPVRIGQTPTSTLYDSWGEFRSAVGSNFGFRVYLVNNIAESCGISFIHNGSVYNITGADGGASYATNKQLIEDVFGVSNCAYNSSNQSYYCSNGKPLSDSSYLYVWIYPNGTIEVADYFEDCYVTENGVAAFNWY